MVGLGRRVVIVQYFIALANYKYKMHGSREQQQVIKQPFNTKSALAYTILSFISLAISSFLLTWLILKQYGLIYTSPIQLSTCTRAYYSLKYSNSLTITALWAAVALSLLTSLILTIIWISRMVAKAVSQRTKYATAILQSLNGLSCGVFVGFCLTFFLQFSKISPTDCTIVYDWIILITLTGLGGGNLVLSLVRYVICICRVYGDETGLDKQKQGPNYETLGNITNDSLGQNVTPVRDFGPSTTTKQHPLRQYAPTKIKQYPIDPPKKQYPISPPKQYPVKQYPVRQDPPEQYFANPKQPDSYRQYNNKTDMYRADQNYSRTPKKVKYVGEHESVKSEQWETVAPSKAERFLMSPQPRKQDEKQFKQRYNNEIQSLPKKQPPREDLINNIFLDNESQSSKNEPLFVPKQPFHYQSLAAKIINKNRRDQDISKALSVKKIQPQGRQSQLFEMKQDDGMWVAPTPVRIQSEKSKVYAPLAIRKNYQRKLNKY